MTGRGILAFRFNDVSAIFPIAVVAGGALFTIMSHDLIGAGIGVGAILAYVNSGLLAKRVDVAVDTGNAAAAMIAMQVGLIVTFTFVGLVTVAMLYISLQMTVAMGISFFICQTIELLLYYRTRRAKTNNFALEATGDRS